MTTLQQIELTCPVCGKRFGTQTVIHTNSFGGKRTDFHERAAGTQPLPYFIHTCTGCGFTGTKGDYEGEVLIDGQLKYLIWQHLAPKVDPGKPALTGSEKYEFAAQIAEWQGFSSRKAADLYLRAAWCCVDEGDIEAERYFRIKAAERFTDALGNWDEIPRDERAVLTYLAGELYRRIGNLKKAKYWFDAVESEIVDAQAQQWVVDAARQQNGPMPREWFG